MNPLLKKTVYRVCAISVLILASTVLFQQKSFGQFFTNVAIPVGIDFITDNSLWGCGVSFYDFDHDGWDDITLGRQGFPPRFFRNIGGTFEELVIPISNTHEMKMILWVDFDNDGDSDLFITRRVGAWQLFQNDGNFNFTDISLSAGLWAVPYSAGWPTSVTSNNTYGASWGDYDADGDLDLYICNYHHLTTTNVNLLFRNNGNNTFTEVGVAAGVEDGITTTFQSVFLDTDRNNKQDLYLVNDRIFHQNKLYSNNEDGTFTNISVGSGANIAICAMSGTLGDYDNNGLQDIYVTNSLNGNRLLKNNGNYTFTEHATQAGVTTNANCWGAVWLDYDLDGWLDLFVPTGNPQGVPVQDYFYSNNQNGTFTYEFLSGFQGVNNESYCAAVGDFDNDGFPDIGVSGRTPFKFALQRNNSTTGNYVKISTEGTISNKDGIGTWLDLHAGGLYQSHYTRCGEGYLSQNSQNHIFGLGNVTTIDSLVISWLSGIVETYYNVPINQHHHFIEGMSAALNPEIENNATVICPSETITIDAGIHASYLWSTGETTQTIEVSEPGEYSVQVVNIYGLTLESDTMTFIDGSIPDYELIVTEPPCYDNEFGSIQINCPEWDELDVFLNNVSLDLNESLVSPGLNTLVFSNEFCFSEETFSVTFPDEIVFQYQTENVLCYGDSTGSLINVALSGGTGVLTFDIAPELELTSLPAGLYTLTVTDENGCQQSENFEITQPEALEVSVQVTETDPEVPSGTLTATPTGGTPPYDYEWSNGGLGQQIVNLPSGDYSLTVTDANDCQIIVNSEVGVGMQEIGKACLPVMANGLLTLPCTGVESVQLYSLTGQLIQEFQLKVNLQSSIDIPHLPCLIRVVFENGEEQTFKSVYFR